MPSLIGNIGKTVLLNILVVALIKSASGSACLPLSANWG